MTFNLNTPRAPSGLERIEDAMRPDIAAISFWGLAFSCSVSDSGACREMPADPLFDLGGSWESLADLVRILFFIWKNICKHCSKKVFQNSVAILAQAVLALASHTHLCQLAWWDITRAIPSPLTSSHSPKPVAQLRIVV